MLTHLSPHPLQSGILPFPRADMSFPTSRDLLIYLHASAQQHDFRVYRSSPTGSDVQMTCRLGHTQSSHRPRCGARYHFAERSDRRWSMVEDTYTRHSHKVLDDGGRPVLPDRPGSPERTERGHSSAEPSKKRPRFSPNDPIPSLPSFYQSPALIGPFATSTPHLHSTGRLDHLGPSPSGPPRPPSSISSAPVLPRPRPRIPPPPVLNTSYLPVLSTFLGCLNPRLSTLASPLLHQCGTNSFDRLVHLLGLSEESLDLVLKDVADVGLIERHLLKKELKRAREAGWSVERAVGGAVGGIQADTGSGGKGYVGLVEQGASEARTVKQEIAELESFLR
jgi:hypothetical protein